MSKEFAETRSPDGFSATERYRSYVLGLLFVVYVVNFVDRQIMTILLQPIKDEFGFSDGQMGLLTGLAFALLYATLGIPIARLADRSSRSTIIACSLFVWSLFTAACGLAQNFWHLLVARVGVGIGEAGCSPPAYSLISDYFAPHRRATAISVYSTGIYGGIFVGYLLGGWVEYVFGWRIAFLVVGLPGVCLALVVRLTLREPPRGFSDGNQTVADRPPFAQTIVRLWRSRTFFHMSLAAALHAFVGYGAGNFMPAFLIRSHGMTTQNVGTWMAFIVAGGGFVGVYFGGLLSDRLATRFGDQRYRMWVPAVSTVIGAPLALMVQLINLRVSLPLLGEIPMILLILLPTWVFASMYLGPTFAMTQSLVGIRERAVAGAVLLFVVNLIGLGLGPWLTGLLSDQLMQSFTGVGYEPSFAAAQGLRYALCVVAAVNLWSAYHYFVAAKYVRSESL